MVTTMSDSKKKRRAGKEALIFTKAAIEALPTPSTGTARRIGDQ